MAAGASLATPWTIRVTRGKGSGTQAAPEGKELMLMLAEVLATIASIGNWLIIDYLLSHHISS